MNDRPFDFTQMPNGAQEIEITFHGISIDTGGIVVNLPIAGGDVEYVGYFPYVGIDEDE